MVYVIIAISLLWMPSGGFAVAPEGDIPFPGGELVVSLYATPPHLNPAIQSGFATRVSGGPDLCRAASI